MPELNPLSNEQIFLKKIAENTGSNYNTGDVSEINPLTIDQILLKEIAANTAEQSGDITELEGKVADNASAIEAIVNVNAGCNLLPCSATSQTIEGITWTVNSDGTVTASGTATANGSILTYHRFTSECVLNGKEVVLKGCPAGGDASSYTVEGFRVAGSSSYQDNRSEFGEGVKFTWNNDSSQVVPEIQLYIAPNYAIQGTLTFKPMLYDARLKPTGYVPYAMTNRELTKAQMKTLSSYIDLTTNADGEATSDTLSSIYPDKVVMGCIIDYDYYKPYAQTHANCRFYYQDRIMIRGGSSQPNMEFRVYYTLLYHDR